MKQARRARVHKSSGRVVRITCPSCGRKPRAYLRLVVNRFLECPYCGAMIEPFARRSGVVDG